VNLFVQPLAEPVGYLKYLSVSDQFDDVSGTVEYGSAVRARLEMSFHSLTQLHGDLVIKVIRDFPPYLYATNLDRRHLSLLLHHGRTFL